MMKSLALVVLVTICSAQFIPIEEYIAEKCNFDADCISANPVQAGIYVAESVRTNAAYFQAEELESPLYCPSGMYPTTQDY